MQLLDFQPLLLGTHATGLAQPDAGQDTAPVDNGRSCTFMEDPQRLQALLEQVLRCSVGLVIAVAFPVNARRTRFSPQ